MVFTGWNENTVISLSAQAPTAAQPPSPHHADRVVAEGVAGILDDREALAARARTAIASKIGALAGEIYRKNRSERGG